LKKVLLATILVALMGYAWGGIVMACPPKPTEEAPQLEEAPEVEENPVPEVNPEPTEEPTGTIPGEIVPEETILVPEGVIGTPVVTTMPTRDDKDEERCGNGKRCLNPTPELVGEAVEEAPVVEVADVPVPMYLPETGGESIPGYVYTFATGVALLIVGISLKWQR
jgi:hypothetical protein